MIRPIEARDVDSILAVQSVCPEIAQWTAWDYARVARGEMAGWVAEEDGVVRGFLVARRIGGDLEILNFAVHPDSRRRGVGAGLLQQSFAWGKTFGAEKSLLEVRASNLGALRFYEKHGFEVIGRRKQYYVAPVEDALVLSAPLK
ncbi:MAG TPA: GNAT family N-acetyltransferase [Candidatus Acidoferrales bacterium]|nr:GNAT family N-acetyltransferase [Candidatus Acidoferrales bacterium]